MKYTFNRISAALPVFAAILFFSACSQKPSSSAETDTGLGRPKDLLEAAISESEVIVYDLSYQGILPCKDCGGIKTTLKISTKTNKFSLKEEFLKTEIAPSVLLGNYNTERGFEKDEDATMYVLNDELPESEHLYFVRESGKNDILLKLDNEKKRTNHPDFILTKISE